MLYIYTHAYACTICTSTYAINRCACIVDAYIGMYKFCTDMNVSAYVQKQWVGVLGVGLGAG